MGRTIACWECLKRKKKCLFVSVESTVCIRCRNRGRECSGQHNLKQTIAPSESKAPLANAIGPSSTSWKLSNQQLSYSLTHHLLTVHIRYRPQRIFGGILEHEWDEIGDVSASVNGKASELSPAVQALVALALADGARLSTHSSIVGFFETPVPQFGTFTSVDDKLLALGSRRSDAVDRLNAQAMEAFDTALSNTEDMDPATKMQLLFVASSMMPHTSASRDWSQHMAVQSSKYILEFLQKENLGQAERLGLYGQAFFCVGMACMRSASFGKAPPLTHHEFLTAIPFVSYPTPPTYHLTPEDLDLVFRQFSRTPEDFGLFAPLVERVMSPCRLRVMKITFLWTYGEGIVDLKDLITIVWEWLDEIYGIVDGYIHFIRSDPRFGAVEKSRGTAEWSSWALLHTLFRHFYLAESVNLSLVIGAHLRVLGGGLSAEFLASSQKRCWEMLCRADFMTSLRDTVLNYDELGTVLLGIQMIVSALPATGPCAGIPLHNFPSLMKAFRFMSFSSAECGDFLNGYQASGAPNISPSPREFVDGTSPDPLPPHYLLSTFSNPPVSSLIDDLIATILSIPSPDQASEMIDSALRTLAEDPEFSAETAEGPKEDNSGMALTLVKQTLDELASED